MARKQKSSIHVLNIIQNRYQHVAIQNFSYGYIRNYRYSKGNPMAGRNSLKPSFTVHVNFVYLISQFSICRQMHSNQITFSFLENCLNNTLQYTGYPVCRDLRHRIVHYMQQAFGYSKSTLIYCVRLLFKDNLQ